MRRAFAAAACALVVAGCAAPGPTVRSGSDAIPIAVHKPEGAGPFPAIVMLHDCSGLGLNSSGAPGRWATRLVQRGYVVAMPDSFAPRGYPNGVCADGSRVTPKRRDPDVYAALRHLQRLPYVQRERIGVMGGSHGGATTLVAMNALPASADRAGFVAGLALYPGCGRLALGMSPRDTYQPSAPVLILAAALDDWTPAAPCEALVAAATKAGHPISIKVYPDAHHSFDSDRPLRRVPHALQGKGATIGGNPAAWADAMGMVDEFFDRHLKKR